MHEISHNLAFQKVVPNKSFGVFANTATIFPHFSMFQRYHMEHHRFQGIAGIDVDVPSKLEGMIFINALLKTVFVLIQSLLYVFRPLLIKPKSPGFWELVNWSVCLVVAALTYSFFGHKSLVYLCLSSLLGSGLHPIAGHFIAEHYVWIKGQETYSYYGPLNIVCFNVGYHNEHHDFPRIPGSRLPLLKKMVPEYYNNLPSHPSWAKVIFDFIMDPTVGPLSRVVRNGKVQTNEDTEFS
jgi:sphingolipid delta-4 desaturase